jgi:hypothetical protein
VLSTPVLKGGFLLITRCVCVYRQDVGQVYKLRLNLSRRRRPDVTPLELTHLKLNNRAELHDNCAEFAQ